MSEMEAEPLEEGGEEEYQEEHQEEAQDDGEIGGLSVEEQAKLVGWNPDHPAGKSAEEFLARNQQNFGLARAENEKLFSKIGEMEQTMTHMAKFLQAREERAMKQGYDRAIAEQKQRMEQAVEDADRATFDDADSRIKQLQKQRDEFKPDPIVPEKNEARDAIVSAISQHLSKNPQLFDNHVKQGVWQKELHAKVQQGLSFEECMKAADQAVVQVFNLKRTPPGGNGGSSTGKPSKFAQLPKEAKDAFAQLKRQIPELTEEEYVQTLNEVE